MTRIDHVRTPDGDAWRVVSINVPPAGSATGKDSVGAASVAAI